MNVVYLRLLGVDCCNWQVTAYKAVRKLLGHPMQLGLYWLSRASIDFCRFECVGLQQLLELVLRSWLWYSKLIWLRWHIWYLICESRFMPVVSAALNYLNHSVVRYQGLSQLVTIVRVSNDSPLLQGQLIQRVSASLVLLSNTLSGKTAPFISTSRNKLTPPPWFYASTDDQQPRKPPAVQRAPRVVLMREGSIVKCAAASK